MLSNFKINRNNVGLLFFILDFSSIQSLCMYFFCYFQEFKNYYFNNIMPLTLCFIHVLSFKSTQRMDCF